MTSPSNKADQEILFNALLAAQASIDAALREARLLVGMPQPPSEREKVLREVDAWEQQQPDNEYFVARIFARERYGLTLDGDGNG